MIFFRLAAFALLFIGFATINPVKAQTTQATETPTAAANQLPNIELANTDGQKVNIAQNYAQPGRLTIFSFWATWCAPCKKELRNIAEVYDDWQTDYGVKLVAVSTDDARSSARVKPLVDAERWTYEVLLDVNEDFKRAINAQSVPHTILVNENGKIIFEHSGYVEGDEDHLEEAIKAYHETANPDKATEK
ncbi:MAG: TlpA family protein disulfide reductase [Sphingobacteriales bacterium]|jgi:cytochrome c biogenesis protein CcmG/thiol:disulfide interchange protein DsbE|nr:TlpA family protein disulfide reductase [Sphingobacteriales bacterium]MBP9141378.1 TlpA family protein disulfide reductase [Chitinophagales bacterium]MDA0198094.1 TlpA disulfide reductase family protein [Bacteroidota bacterium]MBK6890167.1 TlpA family protein disulfide reductase [Sphingobacteriales bacterium]MBK7527307.1 TlpA family protein disulfide reductase [Sphingobacteriales bacterium]